MGLTLPHYADARVTVYAGNCLDASVDAVVCDPPYGLEFMGKEWDRFVPENRRNKEWDSRRRDGQASDFADSVTDRGDGKPGGPSFSNAAHYKPNTKCKVCGLWQFDKNRCRCARPDFEYRVRAEAPTQSLGFQAWCELWATECLRVLKPGGHMLAFGGTRTWHRLACAIEDAGFEVRDNIAWLYGSGFPKSLDVSKAIDKAAGVAFSERPASGVGFMRPDGRDGYNVTKNQLTREGESTDDARTWQGWGTALKPAFEPIVVARKPLTGTVAANVLAHGTGALNIDGCRVSTDGERVHAPQSDPRKRQSSGVRVSPQDDVSAFQEAQRASIERTNTLGRWPANVSLDESQAAELDATTGELTSGANPTRRGADGERTAYGEFAGQDNANPQRGTDVGGASRFFYTAKAPGTERVKLNGTAHPTVKPLDLMRWLVRLVTPPGGLILDPFAGSGTTVEACLLEGFRCVAIEREPDYLPLIMQRINRRIDPVAAVKATNDDGGLFDLLGEETA